MTKARVRTDDIRTTTRVTTHPGAILQHEFLVPNEITATAFAAEINVPANRMTELVKGRRNMTADTALKLAKRLGTSPEFWMNLQSMYDLSKAVIAQRKRPKAA